MNSRLLRLLPALLLVPTLAHAHPGHDFDGFSAGLTHPLHGMDHLLAMFAVGLWAVQLGGRAWLLVPLSFVSAMILGGVAGAAHLPLPMAEQGILASVFLLGAFLMVALKLPLWASMSITSLFALCHGFAHGAEMPATASGLTYGAGFIAATVLLHAAGIGAGLGLRAAAKSMWLRAAGAAVMTAGFLLLHASYTA